MALEEWDLNIQTENPVDFESLAFHGCDIRSYYEKQDLMDYFDMLNGPTYTTLVRHFWVRALVYDKAASEVEETQKILLDPTLEGKTREEMGLEPFRCVEMMSNIMGIPMFISKEAIAVVLRRDNTGKYAGIEIENPKKSPWKEIVNKTMFGSKKKGKYSELSMEKKMLLKIHNETFFQKVVVVINHHWGTECSFIILSRSTERMCQSTSLSTISKNSKRVSKATGVGFPMRD
jgi:hypothetical protein